MKARKSAEEKLERAVWRHALVVLACIWLYFTAWARPLALPDEGRYVGVAWEMVRSGNWLVPTLDGLPYFQKPPLFYWITAAGLRIFGKLEFAVRLAPLLGATITCVAIYAFAHCWWSRKAAGKTLLTLVTMPLLFAGAQFANMDMLVAGCITGSILSLAHVCLLDKASDSGAARLAGYAFAGFGVLAKGVIGLVLPGMVLVIWCAVIRKPRLLRVLLWLPGWLLFAFVAAPWFILMEAKFPQFTHYFFIVQHIERFTQTSFNNAQPIWFYPVVLAVLCLPWSLWLLVRRCTSDTHGNSDASSLMWVWLLTILLFFSIPNSKLAGYILPVVPPLAYLSTQRWDWTERAGRMWRNLAIGGAALAAFSCVALITIVAHNASKSMKSLGAVLAGKRDEQVVFLQAYYFDLPFYADLAKPVPVIDDWDPHARSATDDWHRELREAAAFAPTIGTSLLRPPSDLEEPNCQGRRSLVVGDGRLAMKYPMLARLEPIARHNEVFVWEVPNWIPEAQPKDCSIR